MFASIKPNLFPQSNLLPSNSVPNKPGESIRETKLSVNWISFPKPFFPSLRNWKIFELSIYLPTIDRFEGASLLFGFSTTADTVKKFLFFFLYSMTP